MIADWVNSCECCGQTPIIKDMGMCAVCVFGEADAQQELIDGKFEATPKPKKSRKAKGNTPKGTNPKNKKTKLLPERLKDFESLKPFSHDLIAFNDHYHIRLTSPSGNTYDYFPVSEKYKKKGSNIYRKGLSNLIDTLNEES